MSATYTTATEVVAIVAATVDVKYLVKIGTYTYHLQTNMVRIAYNTTAQQQTFEGSRGCLPPNESVDPGRTYGVSNTTRRTV